MIKMIRVGQLVKSKSGRDKGRHYLVSGIVPGKGYVMLIDGKKRNLSNPKKKNLSHIQVTNTVIKELAELIQEGSPLSDQKIRGYLQETLVD